MEMMLLINLIGDIVKLVFKVYYMLIVINFIVL